MSKKNTTYILTCREQRNRAEQCADSAGPWLIIMQVRTESPSKSGTTPTMLRSPPWSRRKGMATIWNIRYEMWNCWNIKTGPFLSLLHDKREKVQQQYHNPKFGWNSCWLYLGRGHDVWFMDDHDLKIDLLVRFVGKDQSVMAATCLANPGLCLLVKSNGNWFYLQVIS